MKKFDLQLFASAVPGKRIVYLFRRLSKQAEEGAWNLAFVTENVAPCLWTPTPPPPRMVLSAPPACLSRRSL